MDCEECGDEEATVVEVTFTDGADREIPLCDDCRESYRNAELVEEVKQIAE